MALEQLKEAKITCWLRDHKVVKGPLVEGNMDRYFSLLIAIRTS